MGLQGDAKTIRWRLHLVSSPQTVYELLATDDGRARFWAESAVERDGIIRFEFPNGLAWEGPILDRTPYRRFAIEYIEGSRVVFDLEADGHGGTELEVTAVVVREEWRTEETAECVSVLLALKAAADHGVDLRSHDPSRTWDQGYADN